MARMTKLHAEHLALVYDIPLGKDFHALTPQKVANVLECATATKYRKPKNANGSRARYFYAYMNRAYNGSK